MEKKQAKVENVMIKFRNTTFMSNGLSGMTRDEFKKTYTSKIDVKAALKVVGKYLKK